jgi:hypothetical protein
MRLSLGLCLLCASAASLATEGIHPPDSPAPVINSVTNSATPASSSTPSPDASIASPSADAPGNETNLPAQPNVITVTAKLDAAREQIAPSLGAVTYTIGDKQIQSMSHG